MTKSKLSVVVSAFNEEKKIEDCIDSVSFADEVILIDNSSVDTTAKIAKSKGAKVFTQPNNLMLNVNKNFGFTKALGDWILCLDADERVTKELQVEIEHIMENSPEHVAGFWIPRKNIIFGKWIEHTGWYPDYQMRLFRRGSGRFAQKHVHEMITIEGQTEHLKENLLHYNFESIAQFIHKHVTIYAPNEADVLLEKGYVFSWQDSMRMPFREFLSRFFAREGYKDGLHGLTLSMLMAFYHLIIFLLIWEKKGFIDERVDVLGGLHSEYEASKKEVDHWVRQGGVQNTKNPFTRIMKKALHKTGIT